MNILGETGISDEEEEDSAEDEAELQRNAAYDKWKAQEDKKKIS